MKRLQRFGTRRLNSTRTAVPLHVLKNVDYCPTLHGRTGAVSTPNSSRQLVDPTTELQPDFWREVS